MNSPRLRSGALRLAFAKRTPLRMTALSLAFLLAFTPLRVVAADMSSVATLAKPAPGGVAWKPSQIAALHRAIDKLLAAPTLRGAQVGFVAIDTVRKPVLYSRNPDQEFMPASNFKLLVGSAALQLLGAGFTFTTTVAADAPPGSDGTITGNLYLRGGGDALLSVKDLDDAAASLTGQGVLDVSGEVVTDASHFDAQRYGFGWSWDDFPYYYAPVVSALELDDGVIHMFFLPGPRPGTRASIRLAPRSDTFGIINNLTTGPAQSKDTSELVRPWDNPKTIEVTGSYPLDDKESGDVRPSVPDPESYARDIFARALFAHGVAFSGATSSGKMPASATALWIKRSEAMPLLLADFWYSSDNLMGELFLKELGVHFGGEPGTVANGVAAENQYLRSIGVDPATVSISDGSGLSQYDRITPRDLVRILQSDWNGPNRDTVLDALPVAGVRGTLKSAYKGTAAENNVFAKTGSISHVRTISGFVKTKTHGPVTFSFMINQWMGESQPHGAADLATVRGAVLAAIASQ